MGVQINGSEGNVIATQGTFSGDVGIGGTLTYEDVTNIDSVGLITARTGIEIGARPGVAASISVDGNMIVSGISTFGGDVQVPDKIIHSGDTNTAIRFPEADTVTVETGGSERLRIKSDGTSYVLGDFGVGTNSPQSSGLTVENSSEARLRVRAGSNASNGEVALRADGVNTQLGTWSDHDLKLVRNTTEVASLNANGIAFPSGKGIDFSATSDASGSTSELLDDYEEGSWTPTARNDGSFTSSEGRYVKIGQQVTVWGYIPTVTNNTSNNVLQCSGLPFTVASGGATEYVGTLMIRFVNRTSLDGVSFNCYTNASRDYVEFYACRDDGNNYEAILHSDLGFTNSNGIRFCLTYVH